MKIHFIAIHIFNMHFFYVMCIESSFVSKIRYLFDKSAKSNNNSRINETIVNTTHKSLLKITKEFDKLIKDFDSSDLEKVIKILTTVSLEETKATTVKLLTEEPQYTDWEENWSEATFLADSNVTRTSTTVNDTRERKFIKKMKLKKLKDIIKDVFKNEDPSLLESEIDNEINKHAQVNYLGHYSGSPKTVLRTNLSIENVKPLLPHSSTLEFNFTTEKNTHTSHSHATNRSRKPLLKITKEFDKLIKDFDSSDLEKVIKILTTVSLEETKATTVKLLTEEPQYTDWEENWSEATFSADSNVTRTSTTVNDTRERKFIKKMKLKKLKDIVKDVFKNEDPSLLESEIVNEINKHAQLNYLGHYTGGPKTVLKTNLSTENVKPLLPHSSTLEFNFTTEKNTHTSHSHATNRSRKPFVHFLEPFPSLLRRVDHILDKVDLELHSPPWMRYEPMQLREKTGQKIYLDTDMPEIQSFLMYPQSRDRWWWEYGKHFMHWYFWHCTNWMVHWKKNPPSALKSINNLNDLDIKDHEKYRKYKENLYFTFCSWLLSSNKTNTIIKPMIDGPLSKKSQISIKKLSLRQRNDKEVGECFYCGRLQVERVRPTRICHRAFVDIKYFKFKHWLKAKCIFRPEYNDTYTMNSTIIKSGYISLFGRFYTNMCVTHFTDVGELYTARGCRRQFVRKMDAKDKVYIQSTYDALDTSLFKTNKTTCAVTPYSQFIPFTRAKSGLFVRAYACICTGELCNSSCRLLDFIELPYFIILFVFNLYVRFRE